MVSLRVFLLAAQYSLNFCSISLAIHLFAYHNHYHQWSLKHRPMLLKLCTNKYGNKVKALYEMPTDEEIAAAKLTDIDFKDSDDETKDDNAMSVISGEEL
jgi:hypothetical protein